MRKHLKKVKRIFKRPVVSVDENHAFWLKVSDDNVVKVCYSRRDLKKALKTFPDALKFHKKEDFALWFEKVFNNKKLANKIRNNSKSKIIKVI